ncbi:39S ribosomal protein L52, mitochondrial [Glossina fuscipes]|uniref:Large ribosomal subunit protein mL52 n=1 Tax=Glossina fuscipes TaxID=7396 RepID=A0A9C5YW69_9MUSC|nr:39S ribosomal protein L52, mitochondrial [Glossina fuscipes]
MLILKVSRGIPSNSFIRKVSSSGILALDQRWREEHGLPANPNAFGPLHTLPDYKFPDGRPTPMGSNQRRRLMKQREIAAKIVAMCKELDDAKERYIRLGLEKQAERKRIMEGKLKPKGKYLLKSDHENKLIT